MRLSVTALKLLTSLSLLAPVSSASSKRGLVYIHNDDHPKDDQIYVEPNSELTWYYNYENTPTDAYGGIDQSEFEFVPMMWGEYNSDVEDTSFLTSIQELTKRREIKHVLGFNEPDGQVQWGGSDMSTEDAAKIWVRNIEPLKELDIKLGLPCVLPGVDGKAWLEEFLEKCAEELGDSDRNCTFDFVPVHWYDNFEGFASHIGERVVMFPDLPIWVTEYAYAHQSLPATQDFYKTSAEWMDGYEHVERYSYFGTFRSQNSNVGPNAAFLNRDGELTDIGSWYLGGEATGIDPQSGSDAGRLAVSYVIIGLVGTLATCILFA